MSNQTGKDVIYIDIDDEITALIDKVRASDQRIVALVLPKRATVLQSIVNMKLLKRTSDEAKKHLVLITSEAGLLPLAGAVGIYVAKSLQSRPEIPQVAGGPKDLADDDESVDMNDASSGKSLDKSRPVGEYAGAPGPSKDDEQPIELDNTTPPAAATAGKKSKGKKNKKLSVPDFNKFRLWILLGGAGLVLLVFLWFIAFQMMPRATILVKTDSEAVDTNIDLTLDTEADTVDTADAIIPSKLQQTQKAVTQKVDATGTKDKGTKASGQVTIKNCGESGVTIPAGTGMSSSSGLTFISQNSLSLDSGNFSGGGVCKSSGSHVGTVSVVSQSVGDKYNIPSTSYTISGYPSTVTGSGSQMTGGTSNIVKVVTQSDIDSAKQKILEQDATTTKAELVNNLRAQGLYVIEGTYKAGDPEVAASATAGTEADSVTVTGKITYTMSGVKESDLKKLIANEVNKQIDESKQKILDYGLDSAVFKLQSQQGNETLVTLQDTAIAGSDLDFTTIKKQVAGKKAAEAKQIIGQYPGVTSVDVSYSPFWVSSIPSKVSKITISIEKPASKNVQ